MQGSRGHCAVVETSLLNEVELVQALLYILWVLPIVAARSKAQELALVGTDVIQASVPSAPELQ